MPRVTSGASASASSVSANTSTPGSVPPSIRPSPLSIAPRAETRDGVFENSLELSKPGRQRSPLATVPLHLPVLRRREDGRERAEREEPERGENQPVAAGHTDASRRTRDSVCRTCDHAHASIQSALCRSQIALFATKSALTSSGKPRSRSVHSPQHRPIALGRLRSRTSRRCRPQRRRYPRRRARASRVPPPGCAPRAAIGCAARRHAGRRM